MSKRVITSDSFAAVMEEVSKEVKTILDTSPEKKEEKIAFTIFLNTLKVVLKDKLAYLPVGERDDVETVCAVWMDVGILLGKAPQILSDILKRTRAKISLWENDG